MAKPLLTSRDDFKHLKQFSDLYARNNINYSDIPYKYRIHIKEDIHSARDKFDKAVQAEKQRYENSNTGKFTNFMGQVVTAPLALPASEVVVPAMQSGLEPIVNIGKKKIVEPVKNYLTQHPTLNKIATGLGITADVSGTGYGFYNFFSPNGYKKTGNKFNDGNLFGAFSSLFGDVVDLSGFGGVFDLARRGKNAYNSYRVNRSIDEAIANLPHLNSLSREDPSGYSPFILEDLPGPPPEHNNIATGFMDTSFVPDQPSSSEWTPLQRRAQRSID